MEDGFLSADSAGRAKMADLFITLAKVGASIFTADATGRGKFAAGFIDTGLLADGCLSADATGRAKMADDFLALSKVPAGMFTADATGRGKFATGFVNTDLVANRTRRKRMQSYIIGASADYQDILVADADTYWNASLRVPEDYVSGGTIKVYGTCYSGAGNMWFRALYANIADLGEAYNTHYISDSTDETVAMTTAWSEVRSWDVSAYVTAGSFIDLSGQRYGTQGADTAGSLKFLVEFEYTADS